MKPNSVFNEVCGNKLIHHGDDGHDYVYEEHHIDDPNAVQIVIYCEIEEFAYRSVSFSRYKEDIAANNHMESVEVYLNLLKRHVQKHFDDKNQLTTHYGVKKMYMIQDDRWQWVSI